MNDLRKRLLEQAPTLFAAARDKGAAVLGSDGRVARCSVAGTEWVAIADATERAQALAIAQEIAGRSSGAFSHQDPDGTTLSGVLGAAGWQLCLRLTPPCRLGALDVDAALPEPLFAYLRALVRLGDNLWIAGDTGFELDFAAALCADDLSVLVHSTTLRPLPYGAVGIAMDASLEEAIAAKSAGGFSSLIYSGQLNRHLLSLLSAREGIIFCEHTSAIDRALARAGILAARDSALELVCFGAVVSLARSRTGGVIVRQIAECQPAGEGVAYTPIAARSGDNARWLLPVSLPLRIDRLREAGLGEELRAFADPTLGRHDDDEARAEEASAVDVDEGDMPPSRRQSLARSDVAAEEEEHFEDDNDGIGHDDPGWELDAGPPVARRPTMVSRESDPAVRTDELVQAPGRDGVEGMFRARPVVRPAQARGPAPEAGTLTLDTPQRKIIIPEAPSSTAQKRSFAEILKERHRFPLVSEHGPTLTPPLLRDESGRLPGEGPDDDIVP